MRKNIILFILSFSLLSSSAKLNSFFEREYLPERFIVLYLFTGIGIIGVFVTAMEYNKHCPEPLLTPENKTRRYRHRNSQKKNRSRILNCKKSSTALATTVSLTVVLGLLALRDRFYLANEPEDF